MENTERIRKSECKCKISIRNLSKRQSSILTQTFVLCFLIASFGFVLSVANTLPINTYIKLKKYSMNEEPQDGKYMCDAPFGLSGRPVFGGQIFSHVLGCALKETEGYEIISGECLFKYKTDTSLPIIYRSTLENLGKTTKLVAVEAIQVIDQKEEIRATGSVLMQKKKSVMIKEKKTYIETITKKQEDALVDYFPEDLPDSERLKMMYTPKEYWRKYLRSKDEYEIYAKAAHKRYTDVDVYILPNKKCIYSRCFSYCLKQKEINKIDEEEKLNEVYTALAFLSDEHLLETALISKGLCIVNKEYNILTLSHSVKFNNCEGFCMHRPFFYSMRIDSINNNIATCTGAIIQDNIVYANISQTGKIIALPKE